MSSPHLYMINKIHFIVKNYNDNENAIKVANQIRNQINGRNHLVTLLDDGSDETPSWDGDLVVNKENKGELIIYDQIRYLVHADTFVLVDSDDILHDDFVDAYDSRYEKLLNDRFESIKLVFPYWVVRGNQVRGDYSQISINSMSYDLIRTDYYKYYTFELYKIINKFEAILGYNRITLNTDSYIAYLLELQSVLHGRGYAMMSTHIPFDYVIDENPDPYKYVDRRRFADSESNIYNNPKVTERFNLFKKLALEICQKP